MAGILQTNGYALNRPDQGPYVIMVVGVNGVGKTTTIGKLAWRYVQQGEQVLLAAGDTFRAAATEQLEIWGGRVGADVVKHKSGADPSAVVFDALKAAQSRGAQIVIADTAGRLHTKINLMEELKKMKRVMTKVIPGAPHEILLVLDATTGQNALSQAKTFHEAIGVTGIVLTKLDGTAKGGIVTAIVGELGLPVKLIGIGEGMEDLRDFEPEEFVGALFDE
jgi:fused signal recognition particle receptor